MMYWICGITTVISIFLLWPVPETMGTDLTDKLENIEKHSKLEAADMVHNEPENTKTRL